MKILHINSYYATNDMYTQMYDRQAARGDDITAYIPVPVGSSVSRPEYAVISKNHGKYDRILFHLKHKKILADAKKRFKDGNFDIVHSHSLFSNGYIAMQLKKEYGYPYITAVRITDINTFFRRMPHLRSLGLEILQNAERVIIIADALKKELFSKYIPEKMKAELEKKTLVIPNGIDNFWHENMFVGKRKAPEKKLRVVTASKVCYNKNQITVCKALAKLAEKGYDIEYHIVGKVESKPIYKAVMKYPFVKYHSHMTKEGLKELYRDMDIFVMLSHVETFGLAYAEAMSQGLPVVYTKGQGFDGWFKEGEIGYAVSVLDIDGLNEAIEKIINNYDEMSARCPSSTTRFSWDVFVEQYDGIMKECLQENK
ncbi:MAG: glycosyltransferase family 4 protein [Clostridia bacterium]|nr:glycosyltransferase family 4 protein [Clostridia bacterium]